MSGVIFNNTFVPEDHQRDSQYTLLPEGEYTLRVTDTEKATAKKGHDMLVIHFEVARGDKKGLTCIERLNLWHGDETVRQIAAGTLAQICTALGLKRVTDTEDLHEKCLDVTVIHRDSGDYVNMDFRQWRPAPKDEVADGEKLPF